MSIAVRVRVKGVENVKTLMQKLPVNMQEDIGNANYNYTKIAANNMKAQLMKTSQRWRNKIFRGIRAQKMSKFTSVVKIPIEGVWLDSMRPHWVSLKRGRLITQWAREKGFVGKSIFVHPHPFINTALKKSRRNLPKELKRGVRKAFRRSKT